MITRIKEWLDKSREWLSTEIPFTKGDDVLLWIIVISLAIHGLS